MILNNLLKFYREVRSYSEELCTPLKIEDYVPQSVEFASPPKWHLAHTSWFFEEMILKVYSENYKEFHTDYSYLFNSYYNFVGERTLRANRGNMTRPSVDEVYQYRSYVDKHLIEFLAQAHINKEVLELLELGINHEQQHQELLITDLKYTLGHNPLFPVYKENFNLTSSTNKEKGWIDMQEGLYQIGHAGKDFCYDNELGYHQVFLHSFQLSKSLISNSEYLEFINDGGYKRFDLWLDEGWSWIQENEITSPLYWHLIDGEWLHYSLAGLDPLNPNSILSHISFYEANAFAQWKGMRLPTEFEWEASCKHFEWGERWEWTNSAYLPFPGFKIREGAVGEYNGKFMINQMVLRGGSVATSKAHSRSSYRNFFHPHHQWQYSGIRLAKT